MFQTLTLWTHQGAGASRCSECIYTVGGRLGPGLQARSGVMGSRASQGPTDSLAQGVWMGRGLGCLKSSGRTLLFPGRVGTKASCTRISQNFMHKHLVALPDRAPEGSPGPFEHGCPAPGCQWLPWLPLRGDKEQIHLPSPPREGEQQLASPAPLPG